ncbi:hypothetical protein Ocin01_15381 [Orchesella cincta]|uniref:Uncharacterized protein n=1 Tax=Orchesella cincta TaxID=48709 RepID=A0A1D2ME98_ORCCI|nr:hypothetical protein Ocin01_15381 [Orchesella cincta]
MYSSSESDRLTRRRLQRVSGSVPSKRLKSSRVLRLPGQGALEGFPGPASTSYGLNGPDPDNPRKKYPLKYKRPSTTSNSFRLICSDRMSLTR